jgi:DNA (cytosine-5)-methyltransferase 1
MLEIKEKDKKEIQGLRFIDLFAGIGGFHIALNSFDTNCVFSSEWDKHAQKVYKDNFGIQPFGDITKIDEKDIPPHDIICGGFPCQAFSISGKQKGFEDSRGTLFFDIARITNYHKPKLLILENVFNLEKHDNGRTLKVIVNTLEDLGYNCFHQVLNASHYGIPQIRRRIFFVCFRKDLGITEFEFPEPTKTDSRLVDFLEESVEDYVYPKEESLKNLKLKSQISIQQTLELDVEKEFVESIRLGSINRGGQGERIYSPLGSGITLSAYGGGVGSKTGLYLINGRIRKLSPRECSNITGFPKSFKLHENKNQSYKQFGNSVVVDVIQHILIEVNKKFCSLQTQNISNLNH